MLHGIEHNIIGTERKGKVTRNQFIIIKIKNTLSNAFKNFKLYIPKVTLSQQIPNEADQKRAVSTLDTVFQVAIEVVKKQHADPAAFRYMELVSVTPIYTPMAQSAAQPTAPAAGPSVETPAAGPSVETPAAEPSVETPAVSAPLHDDDLGGISAICRLF